MTLIRLHMLSVAIAASYVTLGIFSPHDARSLWAVYALTTLVLTTVTLTWRRDG